MECVEAILSANWPKIVWHCSRADVESKLSVGAASVGGDTDEEAGGGGPADDNDDVGGGGKVGGGEIVCGGGDAELIDGG